MPRGKLILDPKERIKFKHMTSTQFHKLCKNKTKIRKKTPT